MGNNKNAGSTGVITSRDPSETRVMRAAQRKIKTFVPAITSPSLNHDLAAFGDIDWTSRIFDTSSSAVAFGRKSDTSPEKVRE